MQLEKIIQQAEELKLATLRAKEVGIIKYDTFSATVIVMTDTFKELFKDKEYHEVRTTKPTTALDWQYNYIGTYDGLTFETYSREPIF